MHIFSINFISFTAQIFIMHCICKAKKSDFGILGGGPRPLGPPKSAYESMTLWCKRFHRTITLEKKKKRLISRWHLQFAILAVCQRDVTDILRVKNRYTLLKIVLCISGKLAANQLCSFSFPRFTNPTAVFFHCTVTS